jgi:rare lipoprotein A
MIAALIAALFCSACANRHRTASPPSAPRAGENETGIASWYGDPYHGRRTANGEVYDMNKLTAAHRTLPFDTLVRVRNLSNSREVEVRINDRGPFLDGRIIDLSRAGAQRIEMIGPGTAKVRLTLLNVPERSSRPAETYAVQAGAFQDRDRAETLRAALEKKFKEARLVRRDSSPPLWRVVVGRESSIQQAHHLAARVRRHSGDAIVVASP